MPSFKTIAFDADDTLWHNERLYAAAQEQFSQILSTYLDPAAALDELYETESHNMSSFGFGAKAFTISMVETAVRISQGKISGAEVQKIINLGKGILNADVKLLDHAGEIIPALAEKHSLMLITKGDLLDQESKLKRSGLSQYFSFVEITSQKDNACYQKIFQRYEIEPDHFLMIGNSLRSDILPVLELGAHAVYIPFEITWQHEMADEPIENHPGYYTLAHLGELPALLHKLEN